jgi:ABC-type lipoprotein export system ATPase subunit
MLLVGLEGSGKSTLVKIAAMLNQVEIVKIVITPNFNKKDFRETLAS